MIRAQHFKDSGQFKHIDSTVLSKIVQKWGPFESKPLQIIYNWHISSSLYSLFSFDFTQQTTEDLLVRLDHDSANPGAKSTNPATACWHQSADDRIVSCSNFSFLAKGSLAIFEFLLKLFLNLLYIVKIHRDHVICFFAYTIFKYIHDICTGMCSIAVSIFFFQVGVSIIFGCSPPLWCVTKSFHLQSPLSIIQVIKSPCSCSYHTG